MNAIRTASPVLEELLLGDEPEAWRRLGFEVHPDGVCRVGAVRLRLAGSGVGEGVAGWSLSGIETTDLDGLPTAIAPTESAESEPAAHPNGAAALDHVVAFTPDIARTLAAFAAAGIEPRRSGEIQSSQGPRQMAFFRLGEAVLELVQAPEPGPRSQPAAFWGLVVIVRDIDAAADQLGPLLGRIKDAVQPGRRIATIRPEAGLSAPLALMTA